MKALIHLVPRSGSEDVFDRRVREEVEALRSSDELDQACVNLLLRVEDDPFGRHTPFRAGIEIIDASGEEVTRQLTGFDRRLDDCAHLDLSSFLVGEGVVIVASDQTPIRYQYLMRRNASFTHEGYLKRYREIHSRFGIETPGIEGYVQFHVDLEASRRAAGLAGLGIWAVDSVSELHLDSVETFLGEVSKSSIGPAAIADEEVFVDRGSSRDLVSRVEWHHPAPVQPV